MKDRLNEKINAAQCDIERKLTPKTMGGMIVVMSHDSVPLCFSLNSQIATNITSKGRLHDDLGPPTSLRQDF